MENRVKCGQSDERNLEYQKAFTEEEYFRRLLGKPDPVILDVGAHWGESVEFFSSIFPRAEIHSFEPDPQSFSTLKDVADRLGTKAYNAAVSDRSGTVDYYAQDLSHLGGLYPINRDSSDSLGYARSAKNEKLAVLATTLSEFLSSNGIARVDLLKIDVQGAEEDVLKGAGAELGRVANISVECNLFDFYGTSKGLYGIECIMHAQNFGLWDIYKVSKNVKNWRTDWAELVYRRKS
jgi:FkbM family methyltransferase